MDFYSQIISVYPELKFTDEKNLFRDGTIKINDDGDGVQYISAWNYSKPMPKSLEG